MKETLAVPRDRLKEDALEVLQKIGKGETGFFPLSGSDFGQLRHVLRLFSEKGAGRFYPRNTGDEQDIEKKPEFKQPIMYGVIVNNEGRFLVYQRGEAGYDEARLRKKISIGIGGHVNPQDRTIPDSFYREIDEEIKISYNGEVVNLAANRREIKKYVQVRVCGLVNDERDAVGKVHLGIVCKVMPKPNVVIEVKQGEAVGSEFLSYEEYQEKVKNREFEPEGWTELVVDALLKPNNF